LRPNNLDVDQVGKLWARYAPPALQGRLDEIMRSPNPLHPGKGLDELTAMDADADEFDEIPSRDSLHRWFTENFFFGCEAEDPVTAWGFDAKVGLRLNPLFSSDIGHFDVPVMAEVLMESFELVARDLITRHDYQQFVFENVVRLHGSQNPDFFAGTAVESEARRVLEASLSARSAPAPASP
jgi:hypothetical protein